MEFYPRAFFLVCAYVRAGHIEVSYLIGKERRDIPVRTKHLLSLLAQRCLLSNLTYSRCSSFFCFPCPHSSGLHNKPHSTGPRAE